MKHVAALFMLSIASSLCLQAQQLSDSLPSAPMSLQTHTAAEIKTEKLKDNHKILFVGDGERASNDSIRQLVNLFYLDQFQHFQDPLAPYFLLMSKDAKLAMGIGGAVRMRGWYDFAGSMPTNGFVPYMIPVPGDPAQRRKLGGTPGGTAIFLRVIGRNRTLGDVIAYIQGDFSADDYHFKLKKAYVEINDWTIGYNSSTFKDPDAEAPTIDGAGQNGTTGVSAMLLRWNHAFDKHWSMAASLEMPSSQVDADGTLTKKISDWFPDVVAFGQYSWSHSQHLRLSGMLRVIPYRDLVSLKNRNVLGWGVQLSGIIYPLNRLAVYGEFNTGQGYQSTMGDLSIGNYDLVTNHSESGRLYAPFAMGLNAGLKYNFLENVYACVALGEARYFPRYSVERTDYKYGLYGAVNLFWEPTPRMQTGIEYLIGRRTDFNHQHGSANRIDVLFQFSF